MGIEDQKSKLPTLLSGGQKQRVAIARALANNPQIILADEPTGALDSKTSEQIMNILSEISKTKLVIMVTHNSEIANKYSTRIIKLKDGEVFSDTKPLEIENIENTYTAKKTSMSLWQALRLSFSNLLTKKGRTFLTSFASSIGIIGIGLVMALSNGLNAQINKFEKNILTEIPIEISKSVFNFDLSSSPLTDDTNVEDFPDSTQIIPEKTVQSSYVKTNNLTDEFWEYLRNLDSSLYESMQFECGQTMNFVASTSIGYKHFTKVKQLNLTENQINDRYDILTGNFPTSSSQLLLIISKVNSLSNTLITALGLGENESIGFESIIDTDIKMISNNLLYSKVEGLYYPRTDYENLFSSASTALTISGIARIKEGTDTELMSSGLYYFPELSNQFLTESTESLIVLEQLGSETPVLAGSQPFSLLNTKSDLLRKLGAYTTPSKVVMYPKGYEEKDEILSYIEDYNLHETEENKITVQDLSKSLSSTIRSFTSIISIALSIFASISLVVSSIMIGIVTYISVIERTKEIGVLRSLGATKNDVSRVFNAETMILGFFAGLIGDILVFALSLPANKILNNLVPSTFGNIVQPALSTSGLLIVLSVLLTLISGLIPSRIASKKDPVVALRTE